MLNIYFLIIFMRGRGENNFLALRIHILVLVAHSSSHITSWTEIHTDADLERRNNALQAYCASSPYRTD